MKVLALPTADEQIRKIKKDPEAYVRQTRKMKQARARRQRAQILKAYRGTLNKS